MKCLPLLLLLFGCEHFALDHPTKLTYNGYVIEEGKNNSKYRPVWPLNGRTLKFDFRFIGNVIHTPKDSAIHKLYGMSDSFSGHHKNSARLGWRIRSDSTIDMFAYYYTLGHFGYKWIGNVNVEEEHQGEIKIRDEKYIFRVDEKIIVVQRPDRMLWGFRYRCFPYFEDGQGGGAPHRMTFYIYEY